jgi:hypothetical protein
MEINRWRQEVEINTWKQEVETNRWKQVGGNKELEIKIRCEGLAWKQVGVPVTA